jgi:hypothetical protein
MWRETSYFWLYCSIPEYPRGSNVSRPRKEASHRRGIGLEWYDFKENLVAPAMTAPLGTRASHSLRASWAWGVLRCRLSMHTTGKGCTRSQALAYPFAIPSSRDGLRLSRRIHVPASASPRPRPCYVHQLFKDVIDSNDGYRSREL